MVATVNNSPAAAAGKKTVDQPQQAPAARASALRLNNAAAGNDFAQMSRSIAVANDTVSPHEVWELMKHYENLEPSQPPRNEIERDNRARADASLKQSLRQLHEFSRTGELSRSDFDRISKAVEQAKVEPSTSSLRKAVFAIEDPINRASRQGGGSAVHRDRLLQELIERGNFRDDRFDPDWAAFNYHPENAVYINPRSGYGTTHQSNVEKAYSLLSTINPNSVDAQELGAIGRSLSDAVSRGNGLISDSDFAQLEKLVAIASRS